MGEATKGLTKLAGQMYIDKKNGDVFVVYGGWHKTKIVNIEGTTLFEDFKASYGKSGGKAKRERIAIAIANSIGKR